MRNKCFLSLIILAFIFFLRSPLFSEEVKLVEVIDVDRFLLSNGEVVGCLGIHIPALGKKFETDVLREIQTLISGKSLRLEFDYDQKTVSGISKAYIYADGIFINAELISAGYAFLLPPSINLKYGRYLAELESQAKAEKRGLWGESYWIAEPCGCY
jgi:micrococcal nuclease